MSAQPDTHRSIIYALGANLVIAVAKFAGAAFTGSGSLLAEGLHSLADTGNEGLLLWGRKQALTPPSADYPLGHGRETYFWSFIVALLLFSIGGVVSIYEGVHKLSSHQGVDSPWVAVAILVFAAIAESVSLAMALKQINKVRGERSLWRWFHETRRSSLIVVLGEDLAALTGLAFALIAVLATIATGNPVYDAAGSIAIGALLVIVALILSIEIKSLLIGESAHPEVRRAIRTLVESRPEVARLSNLITLQHGEYVVVAVKAEMRDTPNSRDLVAAIARCESALRGAFPQIAWVFFEPT